MAKIFGDGAPKIDAFELIDTTLLSHKNDFLYIDNTANSGQLHRSYRKDENGDPKEKIVYKYRKDKLTSGDKTSLEALDGEIVTFYPHLDNARNYEATCSLFPEYRNNMSILVAYVIRLEVQSTN